MSRLFLDGPLSIFAPSLLSLTLTDLRRSEGGCPLEFEDGKRHSAATPTAGRSTFCGEII